MEFEKLKHDFPEMPEEIRTMIRKEVEQQVTSEQPKRRSRKAARRMLAASLAAVMLCGATVFAGVSLYRLQLQKTGEHGVSVGIEKSEEAASNADGTSIVIPNVRMETGWLPEGMVQTERGKYSFEDTLHQGGVTMAFYRMDTGDDKFEVQHGDVLSSEEFTANGYPGVYLECPNLYEGEISFNQRIYVAFTDVHYVMELYAASDVSKEDALKIAENVKLIPTEDTADETMVTAQDWSRYADSFDKAVEGEGCRTITSISMEEMKNTHKTGERFPVNDQGLTAAVTDVKITDDLSPLDTAQIDDDLKAETDGNGKLRPATIQYLKTGGNDALSREISSREASQKLVCATVEYQNTSSEELTDVLFFGSLARIRETEGQMQILQDETSADGSDWDRIVNHGLSGSREMLYYDVHGGEKGNNYIERIRPGETVTVHMAWVVMEEELETLYLTLDPSGDGYEFSDSSLKIGYVDIRQ